jgi:hypothetical protein
MKCVSALCFPSQFNSYHAVKKTTLAARWVLDFHTTNLSKLVLPSIGRFTGRHVGPMGTIQWVKSLGHWGTYVGENRSMSTMNLTYFDLS